LTIIKERNSNPERNQGGRNTPCAESLVISEKSEQCRRYVLQYITFAPKWP